MKTNNKLFIGLLVGLLVCAFALTACGGNTPAASDTLLKGTWATDTGGDMFGGGTTDYVTIVAGDGAFTVYKGTSKAAKTTAVIEGTYDKDDVTSPVTIKITKVNEKAASGGLLSDDFMKEWASLNSAITTLLGGKQEQELTVDAGQFVITVGGTPYTFKKQ
jgi:hypothetical protein